MIKIKNINKKGEKARRLMNIVTLNNKLNKTSILIYPLTIRMKLKQ